MLTWLRNIFSTSIPTYITLVVLLALLLIALLYPKPSYAGLGVDLGIIGAKTKQSDASPGIVTTEMQEGGVYVSPGYTFTPMLKFGPYFEYFMHSQDDSPADVQGQQLDGEGYNLGVAASIYVGPIFLMGGYNFVGSFEYENKATTGETLTLAKPQGYFIYAGYRLLMFFSFGAGVSATEYSEAELGSLSIDLGSNKRKFTAFRLVASFHW